MRRAVAVVHAASKKSTSAHICCAVAVVYVVKVLILEVPGDGSFVGLPAGGKDLEISFVFANVAVCLLIRRVETARLHYIVELASYRRVGLRSFKAKDQCLTSFQGDIEWRSTNSTIVHNNR